MGWSEQALGNAYEGVQSPMGKICSGGNHERVKGEGCVLAWIVRKYDPVPTSGPTFDEAGNTMSHGHKVAKSTSDVGRRLTVSCFSRNAIGLEPSGAVVGIVVV